MSKRDDFAKLNAEIYMLHRKPNQTFTSHLCAAIWILAKGTVNEIDAKDMITLLCPDFFIELEKPSKP